MRAHDHDGGPEIPRPKAAGLEGIPDSLLLKAGAGGRSDVLDENGILGLQRAVGNAGVGAMLEEERSPVHGVINSGGGSPMAPDIRAEMEARLGHDFSDVRVHTDAAAHESAASVNAHAYTVGSNVVFQRDRYDPGSTQGKTMLAHELTHVTQQRAGEVDGTPTAGGISISDPSDRFERAAVANADRVMSNPLPATQTSAVQRDDVRGPEGGLAQVVPVQRDEAPEEEETGA